MKFKATKAYTVQSPDGEAPSQACTSTDGRTCACPAARESAGRAPALQPRQLLSHRRRAGNAAAHRRSCFRSPSPPGELTDFPVSAPRRVEIDVRKCRFISQISPLVRRTALRALKTHVHVQHSFEDLFRTPDPQVTLSLLP